VFAKKKIKGKRGKRRTGEKKQAWQAVESLFAVFASPDIHRDKLREAISHLSKSPSLRLPRREKRTSQ
jgi:hypothetical protein